MTRVEIIAQFGWALHETKTNIRNGYIHGFSIYVFASLQSDIRNIEYGAFIINPNSNGLEKLYIRSKSRYLKQYSIIKSNI